jgi:hypothetical protein
VASGRPKWIADLSRSVTSHTQSRVGWSIEVKGERLQKPENIRLSNNWERAANSKILKLLGKPREAMLFRKIGPTGKEKSGTDH